MFKVKWNVQNNGIILSDNITDDEAIPAPRPVYLQELQMLEVNKKYRMPKTDLPICWNIDARYYYKGQPFFERRGAGIYSKPDVIYNSDFTFSTLEPVDVDKMLEINREAIETMENEAMDFIMGCYETFKGKVDDYVVAFSGGKDSQVILDLVTRVLPVESFKAVFQGNFLVLMTLLRIRKKIINIASLISNCIMQRVIDMRWICGSSMVHLAELIDGVAL